MKKKTELQKEVEVAFEKAIKQGRLSREPNAKNYVGLYMYMGLSQYNGVPMFKNINTRQYNV